MTLTVVPYTVQQYQTTDSYTVDTEALFHLSKSLPRSIAFAYNTILLGDNREFFTQLLGKPSFMYTGEFKFSCWRVQHNKHEYTVLSAATKGTCYESNQHIPVSENAAFLEEIAQQLAPLQVKTTSSRTPYVKAAQAYWATQAPSI